VTLKACLDCGELTEGVRCEECSPGTATLRGLSARQRGYDAAWERLSKRARELQPWCLDAHLGPCRGELTADHLPTAWQRKDAGLPLRLVDVEVVCQGHNDARGSSRPGSERAQTWGVDRTESAAGPGGKDESSTLSAGQDECSAELPVGRLLGRPNPSVGFGWDDKTAGQSVVVPAWDDFGTTRAPRIPSSRALRSSAGRDGMPDQVDGTVIC
jgi:5-methylcytosine-specific restriction protein A